MNNDDLFSGTGRDPYFVTARDAPGYADIRRVCEKLWETHQPYAEPDFCEQFSKRFHEKFWEMYIRDRLSGYHPDLEPRRASGPDFIFTGPPRVAVEATVASKGTGRDAVPELRHQDEDDNSVPFEQCALRVTQALSEKSEANSAREEAKKGPYVIAINLPFPEAWLCGTPSLSAIATLGVGGVLIDLTAGKQIASQQRAIQKKGGAAISTTAFCSPLYEHVSALIVASVTPFSSAYSDPSTEVLHNPFAINPLPRGWVPFGTEYRVEDNQLKWEEHN
jgi:hypothetical protein